MTIFCLLGLAFQRKSVESLLGSPICKPGQILVCVGQRAFILQLRSSQEAQVKNIFFKEDRSSLESQLSKKKLLNSDRPHRPVHRFRISPFWTRETAACSFLY